MIKGKGNYDVTVTFKRKTRESRWKTTSCLNVFTMETFNILFKYIKVRYPK